MCKLMAFTDASRVRSLKKLVNQAKPLITKIDDDGFGWSAQGAKGAFGERMLEMFHSYRLDSRSAPVPEPAKEETYASFGTKAPVTGGLVLHGRTSTNSRSLLNTHPIQRAGWTLVHNGVVGNKGPDYEMHTTNDTEHLVHHLATGGIEAVEQYLTGYYAFAALDPNGRLHVCRDDNATLYYAWVETIESFMFATTASLLESTVKAMAWKANAPELLKENYYCVFEGNSMVHAQDIKPRGYDVVQKALMSTSLHYRSEPESYAYDPATEVLEGGTRFSFAAEDEDACEEFLEACEDLDSNCHIENEFGAPITLEEFRRMHDVDKLACVIHLPDGSRLTAEANGNATPIEGGAA